MPFPPKTIRVHRNDDPVGETTVVNVSDFDAESMSVVEPEPTAKPEPQPEPQKPAAKRGRPPGAKNKPKE